MKTSPSRQLYDSIQSGEVSFEMFRDMFVDDGLADATQKIHALVTSAGFKEVRITSRGKLEVYTKNANSYIFDIRMLETEKRKFWIPVTSVCVLKSEYSVGGERWTSKSKARKHLQGLYERFCSA